MNFSHTIQSANYSYWIDSQLEPDMLLIHGKHKREPQGMAALRTPAKAHKDWKEREKEFKLLKKREYENNL